MLSKNTTKKYTDFLKDEAEKDKLIEGKYGKQKALENVEVLAEKLAVKNLRNFTLSKVDVATKKQIKKTRYANMEDSFVLASLNSFNGIAVAYALARYYTKKGLITPSEVAEVNLTTAYDKMVGGFEYAKWKNDLFGGKKKLFILRTTSTRLAELNKRGDALFWNALSQLMQEDSVKVFIIHELNEEENSVLSAKWEVLSEKGASFPFQYSADSFVDQYLLKNTKQIYIK